MSKLSLWNYFIWAVKKQGGKKLISRVYELFKIKKKPMGL